MALLFDLIPLTLAVLTKPISLIKLSCIFAARSAFVVIQAWIEFLRAAICFHLIVFWKLAVWAVAVFALPLRIATALHRERQLEMRLQEMQNEIEDLLWDRKEIEDRFRTVIREHKVMETLLAELEDEHDEAIVKIKLLEREVQDLKNENQRLKEVKGKALGGERVQSEPETFGKIPEPEKSKMPLKSTNHKTRVAAQGMILEDVWQHELQGPTKAGPRTLPNLACTNIVPPCLDENHAVDEQKELALSRSLFSAILSLVVGFTVWEAKDPCMPLILALFAVVGMSLLSVIQFFSTIENKPASDAVTLLSFNWFVLGTLTYPTLPKIGSFLFPLVASFLGWTTTLDMTL